MAVESLLFVYLLQRLQQLGVLVRVAQLEMGTGMLSITEYAHLAESDRLCAAASAILFL